MATKKTTAAAKKRTTTKKASPAAAKTTTKVTTVQAAAVSTKKKSDAFSFSRSPLLAASIAEFVGTFLLAAVVLAASGSAIVVFFALTVIVLAVGSVSGSYLNPALTIGAWATRRVSAVRAVSYLVAQVLGALLALVVLNAFVSAAPEVSQQAQMYGQTSATIFKLTATPEGKEWIVLASELLGTAIFGFAVAAATRERNRVAAAFGIGGGLFLGLAIAGYAVSVINVNGAVLNPAIAGTVQALSWNWWSIFIYIVAPIVGAVIGFALRDLIATEAAEVK